MRATKRRSRRNVAAFRAAPSGIFANDLLFTHRMTRRAAEGAPLLAQISIMPPLVWSLRAGLRVPVEHRDYTCMAVSHVIPAVNRNDNEGTVMRRLPTTLLLVAVFVSSAYAESHSFDLDVPAGRFAFWKVEDLGRATKLDADLEVRELRSDSRWIPSFQLSLQSGEGGMALRLVREMGDTDVTASIIATGGADGHVVAERAIPNLRFRKGQRVRVSMDWSTGGFLDLAIGGAEPVRVTLPFTPQSLRVSVSTGELIGHSLSLNAN
jgi:hypothetical protein